MIDSARVVRDTQELVRLDSQNPGPQEAKCVRWVLDRLAGMRVEPVIQDVAPGRSNIVAEVRGRGEAPRLVLLAHMDTVPVGSGWTRDPLGAEIVDGLLYGRGSCDMKAGLAIALNALDWVRRREQPPAGDVVVAATVDEERAEMLGVRHLVSAGSLQPTDQVLALEPTGMRLRLAQVGLRWLTIRVQGRMAHAGRAHLGLDANHILARIVDRFKARVEALPHEDDILGRTRVTCGTFHGGVSTNVVPPSAEAQLDIRFTPPYTSDDVVTLAQETVTEVLGAFPGAAAEVEPLGLDRPPNRASTESRIVRSLRASYLSCVGTELPSGGADGHEAYTDASMVAALTGSTSCTVFGPGSTDLAHVADEFVPVRDIEVCCEILTDLITSW